MSALQSTRFQGGDRVHTPIGEAIVIKDDGVAICTSEVTVPMSQRWAVKLVARAHYLAPGHDDALTKAKAEIERLEAIAIEYGAYRCEGCYQVFDADVTVSCGEEGYFCYPCAGFRMPEAANGAA